MTLLVAASLVGGIVSILSAVYDLSIQETVQRALTGKLGDVLHTSPGVQGQSGLDGSGSAGGGVNPGGGVGSW